MATTARIDVHQHILPPVWRKALDDNGVTSGGWPTPDWSPSAALEMMDRQGIATGVLSVTAPGVVFTGVKDPAGLARAVNEYGAEQQREHPDRIGSFATLPLPDVDASIAEAQYALDELDADGVVVLSNANGKYLGDADYEPLWQELDRRGATVFVHPSQPQLSLLDGTPAPMADYVFDTTRSALNMVTQGVTTRYKNVRVILSHGGGFLPYAAYRFAVVTNALQSSRNIDSILAEMKQFYFDTALTSSPSSLPSLLEFAEPGHILYGSDYPFADERSGSYFNHFLETYDGFEEGQSAAIERGSAELLFPHLKRS